MQEPANYFFEKYKKAVMPEKKERVVDFEPEELITYDDIEGAIALSRRIQGTALIKPREEFEEISRQARLVMKKKEADPEVFYDELFYGIRGGRGELVACARLTLYEDLDDFSKHGFLSSLSVDETFREKGLSKKLTEVRENHAKKMGCRYLETDVLHNNPLGLLIKFKQGFRLIGKGFEPGAWRLSKEIIDNDTKNKENFEKAEVLKVPLNEVETISDNARDGFVGVGLENRNSKKEKYTSNWVLIMVKKNKEEKTKESALSTNRLVYNL